MTLSQLSTLEYPPQPPQSPENELGAIVQEISPAMGGLHAVIDGRNVAPVETPEVDVNKDPFASFGFGSWEADNRGEGSKRLSDVTETALPKPLAEFTSPTIPEELSPTGILGHVKETRNNPKTASQETEKIPAALTVELDSETIRGLLDANIDKLLPKEKRYLPVGRNGEKGDSEWEDRHNQLQSMLETIAEIPTLEFAPGATLMFGDNGGGKSTLLTAIYMRLKAEEIYGLSPMTETLEEYLDKHFSLESIGLSRSSNEKIPSPLAWLMARHITINGLQSENPVDFIDPTTVSGQAHSYGATIDMTQNWTTESHGMRSKGMVERSVGSFGKATTSENTQSKNGDVTMLDEPDTGLSVGNQRKLLESMRNVDRDVVLASAHSVLLWASDIPRIDLDRAPNLGVHKPSEHQELYPEFFDTNNPDYIGYMFK